TGSQDRPPVSIIIKGGFTCRRAGAGICVKLNSAPTNRMSGDVSLVISTAGKHEQLQRTIESVIRGKSDVVKLALLTMIAGGHLLIEDVPGVGKTTLAQAMARSFDCSFQRIQFTSDMLPSDILGLEVFNQQQSTFEFKPGPIFANVVLADEINRTTPKTQSALLEATAEGHV